MNFRASAAILLLFSASLLAGEFEVGVDAAASGDYETALAQFRDLESFAALRGAEPLQAWDVAYWSEKLRQERLGVSDEELKRRLKPYAGKYLSELALRRRLVVEHLRQRIAELGEAEVIFDWVRPLGGER